ncbi:MAG: glycosyltransferase [Candidatus Diapherotrites archaeon]|nr:glycosyltransferase [Candidatus Diapherotrites archaeon]
MRLNNVSVYELHSAKAYWLFELFFKGLFLRRFDILFVGYPGHIEFFIARVIGWLRRKPVVLDKFYSLYDTFVLDRALYKKKSVQSFLFRTVDYLNCILADLIILDTNAQIEFFKREFNLSNQTLKKFRRVFIGAKRNDLNETKKLNTVSKSFTVLFFGTFIPLQGVEYIIKAAKLLGPSFQIHLIGEGQTFIECRQLANQLRLNSVSFEGKKSNNYIMREIKKCDVGLGIFGKTDKTTRVIPNKAFEILAAAKPLISADTLAIRELLTPGLDFIPCKMADEESLSKALLFARKNKQKMYSIAKNGFKKYNDYACPKKIGENLEKVLSNLV